MTSDYPTTCPYVNVFDCKLTLTEVDTLMSLADNTQGLGVGVDARSEQKLLLSVLLNSNRHA